MNQRQPWPQLRESLSDVIAGYLEIASPADRSRPTGSQRAPGAYRPTQ